jgi:acetyl esterase/lipase
MACTIWDSPDARIDPANTGQPLRPDFGALIYPVVTLAGAAAHAGSRANLLGADPDPRRVEALSLESRVSAATPPLFLVHGANDAAVPAANSLQLASRMVDHGVPVSLHLYANGPHGLGMLPGHGPASAWPARLREWLAAQVSP